MNPLLFADWGRMNRLFTKLMWTVAAIMVCIVFAVLATAGHHAAPATHAQGTAAGASAAATGASAGGVVRALGASR
jgi:hypothetical protein